MAAIWVSRNEDGIVEAASVAEYTEPSTLKEWRSEGRTPELVETETVTLNAPLPPDVRFVR